PGLILLQSVTTVVACDAVRHPLLASVRLLRLDAKRGLFFNPQLALVCAHYQCHQLDSNRRLRHGFRSLHDERPFGTDEAVVLAANSGPARLMSRYPAIRIDRRHPRVTARPFHALFDFVSGSVSVLRFEGKV